MTFSVVLFPFGFFLAFSYGLVYKDDANGWVVTPARMAVRA